MINATLANVSVYNGGYCPGSMVVNGYSITHPPALCTGEVALFPGFTQLSIACSLVFSLRMGKAWE